MTAYLQQQEELEKEELLLNLSTTTASAVERRNLEPDQARDSDRQGSILFCFAGKRTFFDMHSRGFFTYIYIFIAMLGEYFERQ